MTQPRPYLYGDTNFSCGKQCPQSQWCNLWETATHVGVYSRPKKGKFKIACWGKAPGQLEDKYNTPFTGEVGEYLFNALTRVGIPLSDVVFGNSVRCFPGQDHEGITQPINDLHRMMCMVYTIEDMWAYDPDVIVAMGKDAAISFLGATSKDKLADIRGHEYEVHIPALDLQKNVIPGAGKKIPLICTWHPSYVKGAGATVRYQFDLDLSKAWKRAHGEKVGDAAVETRLVNSTAEFTSWVDETIQMWKDKKIPYVAFDLETGAPTYKQGLRPYDPESFIVGLCLARDGDEGLFVPVDHPEKQLDELAVRTGLQRIFENIPIAGHNVKFDIGFTLAKWGLSPENLLHDTKMAAYLYMGKMGPTSLKQLAERHLGYSNYDSWIKDFWEVKKIPSTQRTFDKLPLDHLAKYGALDATATFSLVPLVREEHSKHARMSRTYKHMVKAIQIFSDIEYRGNPVDKKELDRLRKKYVKQSKALVEEVNRSPWGLQTLKALEVPSISLTNMGHLRHLIHESMRVPVLHATSKGSPSVGDAAVMNYIDRLEAQGAPEADEKAKVLRIYRKSKKVHNVITKYFNSIPKFLYDESDILHPNYTFPGQLTGRLATTEPTVHTLPKGSDVRRLFVSHWRDQGGILIDADFSQAELRVLASLSKDPALKQAYDDGLDVHRYTGALIYGIPYDDPYWKTDEGKKKRHFCKTIGFGIVYGRGPKSIAQDLQCSLAVAQGLVHAYFSRFPEAEKWIRKQHEKAQRKGSVLGPTGRLYLLPDIKSKHKGRKAEAKRHSQNYPIQGGASDMTLFALLDIADQFRRQKMESRVYGFLHDADMIDCAPGEFLRSWDIIQSSMENRIPGEKKWAMDWMDVPMVAESKIGTRWDGGMDSERQSETVWTLSGPVPFFKELQVEMSRCYDVSFRVMEQWDEEESFALIARKAYEGEVGTARCRVEMELR